MNRTGRPASLQSALTEEDARGGSDAQSKYGSSTSPTESMSATHTEDHVSKCACKGIRSCLLCERLKEEYLLNGNEVKVYVCIK